MAEYFCPSCKSNTAFCVCVGITWTSKKAKKFALTLSQWLGVE